MRLTTRQLETASCKPRIALLGVFGVGNYGNEASLEAMLRHIRQMLPDAQVSCICTNPGKVTTDFGLATFPIGSPSPPWLPTRNGLFSRALRFGLRIPTALLNWHRSVRYLRNVDEMIVPGTGALDDFGESPFELPYTLFRWCIAARLCRTKISFVSIGAGPIRRPLSRWLMKSAARMADYRSYRDEISRDFMASIGFDTRTDRVYPDLVFGLPRPRLVHDYRDGQALSVGVGVMAYYGWTNRAGSGDEVYRTYIEKITQFVAWLLEQGYRVRLLVGEATDQRAVNDLLGAIAARPNGAHEASIVAEPIRSLHELMREIAATDIVVATRFHNVVCALMLNKPVLSCGYARKNDALLADMGLGGFCQHIENLDVARLIRQFAEVARNRERIRGQLEEKNREYQERLAEQYAGILQPKFGER